MLSTNLFLVRKKMVCYNVHWQPEMSSWVIALALPLATSLTTENEGWSARNLLSFEKLPVLCRAVISLISV